MTTRITVLSVFTFILACLAIICLEYSPSYLAPLFFFGIGLIIIYYNLSSHVRFKLLDNQLVVEQMFNNAYKVDMGQLTGWTETGYNIRGHRRRKLLLSFSKKEVLLTNVDYKNEFDELYAHLSEKYAEYKV